MFIPSPLLLQILLLAVRFPSLWKSSWLKVLSKKESLRLFASFYLWLSLYYLTKYLPHYALSYPDHAFTYMRFTLLPPILLYAILIMLCASTIIHTAPTILLCLSPIILLPIRVLLCCPPILLYAILIMLCTSTIIHTDPTIMLCPLIIVLLNWKFLLYSNRSCICAPIFLVCLNLS